jgi:hypothetical protein
MQWAKVDSRTVTLCPARAAAIWTGGAPVFQVTLRWRALCSQIKSRHGPFCEKHLNSSERTVADSDTATITRAV